MSGDANLGPWSITPEDWPSKDEKDKSIAAQYYYGMTSAEAEFYSASEEEMASPINNVEETNELIKVELNKPVEEELMAAMAFNSNKTVIANVKGDNLMENNKSLEEKIAAIDEAFEELTPAEQVITQEKPSALVRFWRFMNKPIYVRTWFGFRAPGAKAE